MNKSDSFEVCPVCNDSLLYYGPKSLEHFIGRYRCSCYRCGTYDIEDRRDFGDSRHLVSAWIRRQNNMGIKYPMVGGTKGHMDDWLSELGHMGFPKTTSEKLDALLKSYADIVGDLYSKTLDLRSYPSLISEVAAKNIGEVVGLNALLSQLGYVDFAESDYSDVARIRAKGWFHIEELRKSSDSGNSAFIAMWFDEPIIGEYRKAVVKAVEACHYKPVIVDQHEFNGFIMDLYVYA